ncbi:MAG: hypothetical protein JXO22_04115 [Phycisphaerae bacterium]|nr:hypothetical protein [Phycisphaerae bacterium]
MSYWHRLHRTPALVRWPLKLLVFLVVTGLVLYPKVWLLPTWLHRLGDLDSVLDPQNAGLAPLENEVSELLAKEPPEKAANPKAVLELAQKVVLKHVPYAWDWDTWGVFDYVPTVAEVLSKGHEDCDGRAVVAASLLRRMGREAWLVSDLKHVWVETPDGATMGPGDGKPTITGGKPGKPEEPMLYRAVATLRNLGRGLTFGIAVFPMVRVLMIWLALCACLAHPWSSPTRRVAGSLLLLAAIALLHDAKPAASGLAQDPRLAWVAWMTAAAGIVLLAVKSGVRRQRDAAAESPAAGAIRPD